MSKGNFDFGQAGSNGEDVKFSADGKPLAYQVEEWDTAKGTASFWVREPQVKGNLRQEIKMHWGKPCHLTLIHTGILVQDHNVYQGGLR